MSLRIEEYNIRRKRSNRRGSQSTLKGATYKRNWIRHSPVSRTRGNSLSILGFTVAKSMRPS